MTSNRSLFTGTLVAALVSVGLMTVPQIACAHGDEAPAQAGARMNEQKPWGIAGGATAARAGSRSS